MFKGEKKGEIMKNFITIIRVAWVIAFMSIQFSSKAQDVVDVAKIVDIQFNQGPFIVEFYRPTCPHCQIMIPRYAQAARSCTKSVRFYRINADNIGFAYEVAEKLSTPQHKVQITGVPFFVFVDSNGSVSEISGQMGAGALEGKIAKL